MRPYSPKPKGSTTHAGGEVYLFDADGAPIEHPIIGPLTMGDHLSVPTLFGRAKAKVTEMRDNRATAMSGDLICWLTFAEDERMCWTCNVVGDAKALAKLRF